LLLFEPVRWHQSAWRLLDSLSISPPAQIPLTRRLLAEALGTAILVATVIGSGIMAERSAAGASMITRLL